jgi:hypothetical protein
MRLQTRAFAAASGLLTGTVVLLWTLLLIPAGAAGSAPMLPRAILFGWNVSVAGAFIGAMWAFAWGFLLGAAFAFTYNIVLVPPAPPPFDWNDEIEGEG